MNGGKLDEIDLKILNILQRDGRMDAQQLSELVNLTRTPVALRIEKMQEAGVIRKFAALLDREKIGRPVLVVTHVKLEKQTTELLLEFERLTLGMPEVLCCLHVSGGWNFILHVSAKTPQAYYNFLMARINSLPNVAHTDSCFVLKECKPDSPFVL